MIGDLRYAAGRPEPRAAPRRRRAARALLCGRSPRPDCSQTGGAADCRDARRQRRQRRVSAPRRQPGALADWRRLRARRAFVASRPSGVRIAAIVALRRLRSPEVARFLTDSDDLIVAGGGARDQ